MNHVDTSTPGVVRIKAFGKMKVDAALIATMDEIKSYQDGRGPKPVSYTHLRAHETR